MQATLIAAQAETATNASRRPPGKVSAVINPRGRAANPARITSVWSPADQTRFLISTAAYKTAYDPAATNGIRLRMSEV